MPHSLIGVKINSQSQSNLKEKSSESESNQKGHTRVSLGQPIPATPRPTPIPVETSLPPGQRGRAKVKQGEIKVEMHYKPEGTKLSGPLLLVILHIVLGVDQLPN